MSRYEEFIAESDDLSILHVILIVLKYYDSKSPIFTLSDTDFALIADNRSDYRFNPSASETIFRRMLEYGFFDAFDVDYYDDGTRCDFRITFNEEGLQYCLQFFYTYCFRRIEKVIADKEYQKYRDFYLRFKLQEEKEFLRAIADYKKAYADLDKYISKLDPKLKPVAFEEFSSKANRFMEFLPVIEDLVKRFDDITKRITYPVSKRLVQLVNASRIALILSVIFFVVSVIIAVCTLVLSR
jgi:hypothetical protein